jgi:hypothetical protein
MITATSELQENMFWVFVPLFLWCQVQAKEPDWVTGLGKSARYSETRYFTGFGVSVSNDKALTGEKIEQAKNSAKSSLVESMRVRVQVSRSDGTTLRSNHGHMQELRSDYRSQVSSTSDMDIEGIEYEVYASKDHEQIFALAYMDKVKAAEQYTRELQTRMWLLGNLQATLEKFMLQGDIIAAQESDNECKKTLDEIDAIRLAMELIGKSNFSEALTAIKARAAQLHRLVEEHLPGAVLSADSLRIALWTSLGKENVRLRFGESLTFFVRVNKPCYLHLVLRLSNNSWTVPDYRYWNFYLEQKNINKDYALPDSFIAAYPIGSDTLQVIATEEQWPSCDYIPNVFSGEAYLVVPRSCIPPNFDKHNDPSNPAAASFIGITTYE